MKKRLLLSVVAGIALVGCSRIERIETQEMDQNAISFGTYVSNNAQTRASVIDEAALGIEGFGVNAYYTGQDDFSGTADPNYMDNTKITYNKDKNSWEYSPVKYWPNNDGDKVSFFAYGPYAVSGGANNITQKGTSLSFTVPAEVKQQVDLVYHNQTANYTLNLVKPAVEATVNFKFDHALSRVSFTVEAAVDETINGNNLLDGNTRINVKKVMIVNGEFYQKGDLNLTDGTWSNQTGTLSEFSFSGTDHFYHTVKDVNAEDMTGDEIDVIQLTRFNASKPQRVLNDESYLMIIPKENAKFKIYVEYDVISGGHKNNGSGTYDESAITNKITSADIITKTFEQGKAYNFNLVLGMTSVKFEVNEVTAWDESVGSQDEWLPENIDSTEDPEIKGLGTEEDPYRIANARQLERMRDNVNNSVAEPPAGGVAWKSAKYTQTANIDLSSVLEENGGSWSSINDFEGSYNGNGHKISGIEATYFALFSDAMAGASIQNINMEGTITNHGNGAVVATNYGTISNCSFKGELTVGSETSYAGSIVGTNYGTVMGCHFDGTYTHNGAWHWNGAIVGHNYNKVIGCYNLGDVTGGQAAGIVGYNDDDYDSYVIACYNVGDINLTMDFSGGGSIIAVNYGYAISCYNAGDITSVQTVRNISDKGKGTTACYYSNDDPTSNDTEIKVDGSTVTWEQAAQQMNQAIIDSGISEAQGWSYTTEGATAEEPLKLKYTAE